VKIHSKTLAAGFGLSVALVAGTAFGGEFPEKPIQFIIPFGAGGGADIEGRLLAKEMGKVLGVSWYRLIRLAVAVRALIPM
jgi:tripartite-type tricarboxylate transporter receptor subunit TctC